MKTVVSTNLRQWRMAMGLKQREVSEKSGIPMKRYQSYEEGRSEPSLQNAKSLAKIYGLKVDDLLTENFEPKWIRLRPANTADSRFQKANSRKTAPATD